MNDQSSKTDMNIAINFLTPQCNNYPITAKFSNCQIINPRHDVIPHTTMVPSQAILISQL